jgi:hypothetical protein
MATWNLTADLVQGVCCLFAVLDTRTQPRMTPLRMGALSPSAVGRSAAASEPRRQAQRLAAGVSARHMSRNEAPPHA